MNDGIDRSFHLDLLRSAGSELVNPGEACERLRRLLGRLVPLVCSQLVLDVSGFDKGATYMMVSADPALEKLDFQIRRRYAPRRVAHPMEIGLRTGGATLHDVTEELLRSIAHDDEHLALLRRFDATQLFVVPVRTSNRGFGVMMASTDGGRKFESSDRTLLELVAERIASYLQDGSVERTNPGAPESGLASVAGCAGERARSELEELFVGIVSHDLRNPLNVIVMAASVLLSQELGERQRKLVGRIEHAGRRAGRLVADLLDVTAARGGELELSLEAKDLHAVVAQAVDDVQAAWPGRVIEHSKVGEATSLFDQARLEQVVDNLLTNALQHSTGSSPVRVETRGEPDTIAFSVVNQGPPIAESVKPHLFTPLRRGSNAGVRRGSVGLGLFIAHHLVVAHGGIVDVSSDEHGTRFTVRLPRKVGD